MLLAQFGGTAVSLLGNRIRAESGTVRTPRRRLPRFGAAIDDRQTFGLARVLYLARMVRMRVYGFCGVTAVTNCDIERIAIERRER